MSENKKHKPTRIITFGSFNWMHWFIVGLFLIGGIMILILPSILAKKIMIVSILVGTLLFAIGVFCVFDHIIYIVRINKWKIKKETIKEKDKK